MMILLLLLIPFASAGKSRDDIDHLVINIKPGATEALTTIEHSGTDIKSLTDQEKDVFHLTKENLQKAVETIYHEKPTDVFIIDSSEINNWHEVKRDFKLKNIKIVNVTTVEVKQSEKVFVNNETKSQTISALVYEDHYSFHSTHHWSGNLQISATVRYELVRPAKVPLRYSYGSMVGGDDFSSGVNVISYGDIEAKFNLNPGQSAKFIISAREVITNVKVEYETKLTGDVVVRYAGGYKGKQFWAYDMNELLRALNVSSVVETQEFVEITYIKDYLVKVIDTETDKEIPYTDLVTPDY